MNWPFINDGRFSCWFRPGKPNALALGWEAGSENKLEQLKINWSSALPSKTSRRSLCWRIGNSPGLHLMRLGSSFRQFSSMSCSNINANRYNEFHHVTPHKNVATVVPWYRKTCRSECMFVPVVDSSATEMSTLGVILLTGWTMNSSRDTRCWSTIPLGALAEIHACGDMNLCVNDTHVDVSSVAEAGSPRF